MMIKEKKAGIGIFLICFAVVTAFTVILIIPDTRTVFAELSGTYPFLTAFVKFALLATVGELIAVRMVKHEWTMPDNILARALIWGILGMFIALAFKIFGAGVDHVLSDGILPGGNNKFWEAFMTSLWCNIFFGPFMMGFHKMTDTYLALKSRGMKQIGVDHVVEAVNWKEFFSFTLLKTLPFFWIPAHTVTFMLPGEFQIIMAAYLSIALGIILNLKKTII